jgi:hypothetical protein
MICSNVTAMIAMIAFTAVFRHYLYQKPHLSAIIIRLDTNLATIEKTILQMTGLSAADRERALKIAEHLPTDAKREEFLAGLITIDERLSEAAEQATTALEVAKKFVEEGEQIERRINRKSSEKKERGTEKRKRRKLLTSIKSA